MVRNNKIRGKGKQRARPPPAGGVKPILKAIQDLKVDTQVRGSPRVADVPRIFLKTRKVFTINQTYTAGAISILSSASTANSLYFSLQAVPLVGGFSAVFDSYMFQQVTVRFVPLGTIAAGSGGYNPLLTAIDYDDANTPTSAAYLQGYDSCQETPLGQYVERTLVPRIAVAAYQGTFAGYGQKRSWLDVASSNVQHYGLKYYIQQPSTSFATLYSIEVDVVISFMSIR